MSQTPLELLTIIAAPALITNASSLLVLSTSNRFARAVDRTRALAAELAGEAPDTPPRPDPDLLEGLQVAKRRTLILVRALTSFYLAVSSFASGTFLGLVGAAIEHFEHGGVSLLFTGLALGAVMIGTLAIATGAVMLVSESRLSLRGLTRETRHV